MARGSLSWPRDVVMNAASVETASVLLAIACILSYKEDHTLGMFSGAWIWQEYND